MDSDSRLQAAPEVSFVVPSYRSGDGVKATLESIDRQKSPLTREILLVDSSPGDDSLPNLDHMCQLRIVRSATRLCPAAARNRGAQLARGRWIAFVDADAVLEGHWLHRLHALLLEDPAAVTGGWVANANPEWDPSCVLHWLEFSQFLPGATEGDRSLISSSNMLLSRERFLSSGGFDESFEMSEDSVFCHHYQGPVRFCNSSGISHRHRTGWPEVLQHLRQLGYWSGTFRRRDAVSGSFLASRPAWSRLLPLWRLPRIVLRVVLADSRQLSRCLRLMPALFKGLRMWAAGFREGLQG